MDVSGGAGRLMSVNERARSGSNAEIRDRCRTHANSTAAAAFRTARPPLRLRGRPRAGNVDADAGEPPREPDRTDTP